MLLILIVLDDWHFIGDFYGMIKSFFKIAWRNLLKNKAFSIINISGLAVGMAIALLIGLWVADELSFDHNHENHDRIAEVIQQQTVNGNIQTFDVMSYPVGGELRRSYGNDFKYVVMASTPQESFLSYEDKKLSLSGLYMDVEAPKMLTLKMLEGSRGGLTDPHSILLPASTAKALFGSQPALNHTLSINNKQKVKVTGVYEDLPENASFQGVGFIGAWDLYRVSEDWIVQSVDRWDNNSFRLYVQLADNANFDAVQKRIIDAKQKYVAAEDKKYQSKLILQPMNDWHLRSRWDPSGKKDGGAITYVWLFTIIGAFVLILACINFMNLSTARSEKRAKEVGIRKTIGSLRTQIIGQFYSESLLVVALGFVLALVLVQFSLPYFNRVAGKDMHIPYAQPLFWLLGVAFVVLTGIIAGSYPALYLSSFKPIKVLKGTFRTGKMAALPRKALVVVQFTISIGLAIATIVVYQQLQYTHDRPVGYNRDGIMMMKMKSSDFYGKYGLLKTELKKSGAVQDFAESSSPLTEVWATNDGFDWPARIRISASISPPFG
jgi:ABC-type antimicrobial peptide transport system permease subunit